MPTVIATLLAACRTPGGWPVAIFAFLLISCFENGAMAEESAPSIDLGAIPNNIRQDIHQLEQDRPKWHTEKSLTTIDSAELKFKDAIDSTVASQKWNEPARIEEIPTGSLEAGRPKLYAITIPLPFQICVLDKQYSVCTNIKF